MTDRFKFRAWDECNKIMHYDFQFIKSGDSGNDWIIFQSDKQELNFDKEKNFCINIYPNPYFAQQLKIMQSTGLKDKNGKLIFEGDIVRYAEYEIEEVEPEWKYTEIVWGGSFDYPAFDLKQHNFDNNGLSEIFACGWTIEVVGNIYESEEFKNEGNNFNNYSDSNACMCESAKQGE